MLQPLDLYLLAAAILVVTLALYLLWRLGEWARDLLAAESRIRAARKPHHSPPLTIPPTSYDWPFEEHVK